MARPKLVPSKMYVYGMLWCLKPYDNLKVATYNNYFRADGYRWDVWNGSPTLIAAGARVAMFVPNSDGTGKVIVYDGYKEGSVAFGVNLALVMFAQLDGWKLVRVADFLKDERDDMNGEDL